MKRYFTLIFLTGLIISSCKENTANTTTEEPKQISPKGIIVFSQYDESSFNIYSIEADGTNKQKLTDSEMNDIYPDISPDGKKIVFSRKNEDTGTHDIWVMDINGANIYQLTSHSSNDIHPTWSPDGSKIAFETDRHNTNAYIIKLDGTAIESDFYQIESSQIDWAPRVSDRIAYIEDENSDGNTDILVFNTGNYFATNPNVSRYDLLVEANNENGISLSNPSWSPDASKISYQGVSTKKHGIIFTADIENSISSNYFAVTPDNFNAGDPSWSPSGEYISFINVSDKNKTGEIWIIKKDGSEPKQLTEGNSAFPTWGSKN